MIEKILEQLNIPKVCKKSRAIHKKDILNNFSLSSSDKKILSSSVESIRLEYVLNKNTININPFIDEDRKYLEINFIKIKISNIDKLKQISNIIQNIPKPLVLFFMYENSICINISPKRINKNDSTKLVVEDTYFTKWIDLENISSLEQNFFNSIAIQNHPYTDFLSFYNSYLDKIVAFNASEHSGNLIANENTKATLDEIASCEIKITEIRNKIKKETIFSDKVNMNIELKKFNDKFKNLKNSL